MREPQPSWIRRLRALTGQEHDTIRWNADVGRWEFVLTEADGVQRSQFWGWFRLPTTGQPLAPDPETGLYPFRELEGEGINEALANLERTFVGNPFDGAGSNRKEVIRRHRWNQHEKAKHYQRAGEAFADMAAERGHRLRGSPLIHVPVTLGGST